MEKMPNLRLRAATFLQNILEEKIFFSELKSQLRGEDLPFINMSVLTTLRHLTALKYVLSLFLHKKIPNKHRLAEYLLLLATCEILYMNTPDYAVINETVENIKKNCDKFLGGMANAVLRKIVAAKNTLTAECAKISPFPQTFKALLQGYTKQEISAIEEAIYNIPSLDISVKQDISQWQKTLQADLLPNGTLRIHNAANVETLPGYNQGAWWVQDVAASLPVSVLGDLKNKKVIDLCAAPGGKTAQLAAKGADVTALDISENRMLTLKKNMQRLNFSIKTKVTDALEYLQTSTEKYDIAVLDAPCSATGTFRRHPEVLHIKTTDDVNLQVNLQEQLLNSCERILKPFGILLYCVCSVCRKEGEEQIKNFLAAHPQFKLLPITEEDISLYGKWDISPTTSEGWLRTLPFMLKKQGGMDSFFICKMQRII